jgi:signal transduction histidine kinase
LGEPGISIQFEAEDLTEVLGNLLENAQKFARQTVKITVTRHARAVSITVEDDGPGVPEDKFEQIIERGTRLDTQRSGSGLGLAIVNEIVNAYGYEFTLFRSSLGGLGARLTCSHHVVDAVDTARAAALPSASVAAVPVLARGNQAARPS